MITVLTLCATKNLAHAKALGDSLAQHNVHHLLNIEQSMDTALGSVCWTRSGVHWRHSILAGAARRRIRPIASR